MKARSLFIMLAVASAAVLAGSCAAGSEAAAPAPDTGGAKAPTYVAGDEAPGPAAGPGERLVPAAAGGKPWYAAELEALGFYVFDAPQAIPPLSVTTLDGKPFGLASLAGKVVLLNFWATWCPPCQREMPSIQRLHEAMKGSDFAVMAVSVGEKKATVVSFLKTNPYTFPIYLDETSAVSGQYVGQGIPTTYLVDKAGKIIAGVIGAKEYDDPQLVNALKVMAGRP